MRLWAAASASSCLEYPLLLTVLLAECHHLSCIDWCWQRSSSAQLVNSDGGYAGLCADDCQQLLLQLFFCPLSARLQNSAIIVWQNPCHDAPGEPANSWLPLSGLVVAIGTCRLTGVAGAGRPGCMVSQGPVAP